MTAPTCCSKPCAAPARWKTRTACASNWKSWKALTDHWASSAGRAINHQLNAPFYVAEVKDGREVIRARCTVEGCR